MAQKYGEFYSPSPATFTRSVPRSVVRDSGELLRGARYSLSPSTAGTLPGRNSAPAVHTTERSLDEVHRWVRKAKEFWEKRQTRFRDDQRLYELQREQFKRSDDLIILSDPKILVKKVARLLARHAPIIEVDTAPGVSDKSLAQRHENFLYAFDQALNYRWMEGLHNPMRYDQAFNLVLRGWITERLMFYPDGYEDMDNGDYAALWRHDIIDPSLVFPVEGGGKIRKVVHSYSTTVGELEHEPLLYGKSLPRFVAEKDDYMDVMCHAVYWEDQHESWWHGVIIENGTQSLQQTLGTGEWLKKPMEIGYNPWVILTANGVSYRSTEWDFTEYPKQIGTGLLDESADTIRYMSKMATKLSELLSLEANPPLTAYIDDSGQPKLEFLPGSRNYLTPRDKMEMHKVGPQAGDYKLLWDILSQRLGRATLPPAFFAEYVEGGFSAATIMAAGQDVLFPYVEAINTADRMRYRKALETYRDLGPSRPLRSVYTPPNTNDVESAELNDWDIRAQGVFSIKVTRDDMTPQEYLTRINAGLAMMREKAISAERFRKEFAKIKNPAAENRDVISEMVYMNEEVIKQLIPAALAQTGKEQLARLWELVQNPMPPMGGGGGAPGMPPQGGDVQGVNPMAPPDQGGMPGMPMGGPPMGGGMAPPQMNNGLDPNVAFANPIVRAMMSQAMGGGGAGGTPPIPGSGSPIQMPQPFFR